MEIEDSEVEVLFITIAVGVALESLDSAIHGFQFTGADPMFIAVQDKGFPQSPLLGGIFGNLDAADFRLADSGIQFCLGGVCIDSLKQQPQAAGQFA